MDSRTAILLFVGLLVGAAAGWLLKPASSPLAEDGRALVDPLPGGEGEALGEAPALGTEVTTLRAELDQARASLQEEAARRERMEREKAALEKRVAELHAAAERGTTPDAPVVAKGARFPYDRFRKTLEAIDWDVAGDAITHIAPLLEELVRARAEGKPLPPSVGSIQRYNGPLVTAALTASQNGVPGTGVNGSFTHPAMLANMVYAALKKADMPLDETQEAKLERIADDFVQEDERRMAGYGEGTLALRKLIEEAALKDRFFAQVDAMVTAEQRAILHPEVVRGRTSADLFSSAVIWGTVLAPQRFDSPEQLTTRVLQMLAGRYQIAAEQRSLVEDLVAEWSKGFPPGYLTTPADALTLAGHIPVAHVVTAATRQLTLFRALLERMPDGWTGAERMRQETFVMVPVKAP